MLNIHIKLLIYIFMKYRLVTLSMKIDFIDNQYFKLCYFIKFYTKNMRYIKYRI